ncbi:MAG: hypothetical protein E2O88_07550 [Bacteroidetes bacterium]|nr:MAG: hypothetical protein E2O88_07550 [Bacteroidota bacterium]
MKKKTVITRTIIIIGILILINLIGDNLFFRLDFTADKRYTLSNATKDIINDLEDVITITAYITKDLPPQLMNIRRDFEDLLIEYETRSDGNIVYEFINPNQSRELEAEAQQNGIGPLMINIRESDQVKQLRAYMGAVLEMGDKSEVIPVIQPGSSMEYSLTTSIKKLAAADKQKIAFIEGHNESPLEASGQLMNQLSILYDVESYNMTDTLEIPAKYKTILIVDPKDTIPDSHFQKLNNFIRNNGRVFIAYNNLAANLSQGVLQTGPEIGLGNWLRQLGVNLGSQYVIDNNAGAVTVQQRQGPIVFNTQVKFPYFPIIGNFADHPVSKGIESLMLPFVSPISLNVDSAVQVTPLALSSEYSGLQNSPVYVDINRQWELNDFNNGNQPVAVALEGPIMGADNTRIVVISNSSFMINGLGQQQREQNADNINFASNAIDWLSDDTGLVDLRTKGITNRPLEIVEDTTREIIKWSNVTAPILIILIYAFIRRQMYFKKKQNWLQGNY